jgi:orotate phosphoribosyltransferase
VTAPSPQEVLVTSGAVRQGHFVLDSGLHATRYFQAVDLLADPAVAAPLLDAVADPWAGHGVAAVVGANEAGSVMAWAVGRRLGAAPHFARRAAPGYRLVGGRPLPAGPVLVVDDITTTGGTARHLLDAVRDAGGDPVGVALLATKGLFAVDLGVTTTVLATLEGMDAHPVDDCPACASGTPVGA